MIDFRYHLVSIVSVFLALAVGIVLGAGPLRGQIGQQLTSQVAQLRQEKDDLRSELEVAQRERQADDDVATAMTADAVRDRLAGQAVVLVLLPGVDTSVADDLTETLTAAGARISGQVRLESSWVERGEAETRERVVADLADRAGPLDPADPLDQRIAVLLARALVTPIPAGADRPPPAAGAQALSALRDAGLLSYGQAPTLATLAVVLAGAPDAGASEGDRSAALTGWRQVARTLDAADAGTVVAGPVDAAEPAGVVGTVRDDDALTDQVSTVDGVDRARGRVAVVLALGEQLGGDAGQYGAGAGARDALPPPAPDGS
ncbi:MAG: copper transporter [Angustibacter sp.]